MNAVLALACMMAFVKTALEGPRVFCKYPHGGLTCEYEYKEAQSHAQGMFLYLFAIGNDFYHNSWTT